MPDTATTAPPIPAQYTAPHTLTFWGERHAVTPAVAEAHLGDGRCLLAFTCADTRPNFYLIRVDSGFLAAGDAGDPAGDIAAVIDALADEFGERDNERELLGDELDADGDGLGWPVLNLDSGYDWAHVADL